MGDLLFVECVGGDVCGLSVRGLIAVIAVESAVKYYFVEQKRLNGQYKAELTLPPHSCVKPLR